MPSLVETGPVVLEKKFFNFVNSKYPLGNGMALYLKKLESPPTEDALCQVWLKLDSSSGEDENKKSLQTDGWADVLTDKQQAIRRAHFSLQLR